MTTNFKLKALSAAVLGTLFATPLYAAEEEKKEAEDDIEVIEIKGFRGSLKKAVNAKRFSDSVSDSIHAEDVGKSTDHNIADALSRVTGMTVVEEDGEGTRVSIRGTAPSMNQISVNGIALTSGLTNSNDPNGNQGADQSVDLSTFNSDILASIDVVKTSSADQDEGSLGANVILRTLKPLSLSEPRRTISVEARHNEFSGENDGRITASFADKFADDTFGVVFTVSGDEQKTRTDSIRTSWAEDGVRVLDAESDSVGSGIIAHDIATGKAIRVLGFQEDDEGNQILDDAGNPILNDISSVMNYDPETQILVEEGDYRVMARDVTDIAVASNIRTRVSATAGFEWQVTDDTNIQLDLTRTTRSVESDYNNFRLNYATGNVGVSVNDPVLEWQGVNLETQTLDRTLNRLSSGFFNRSQGTTDVETDVISFTVESQLTDSLTVEFNAGRSKTTEETDDFVNVTTATWGTIGNTLVDSLPAEMIEPIGIDCSNGGDNCEFFVPQSLPVIDPFDGSITSAPARFSVFDLNANHLGGLTFRDNEQEDINDTVRLDFDYDLDFDNFTSIEFGLKWAKRTKDVHTQNTLVNTGTELVDNSNPNVTYATAGMQSIGVVDMLSSDPFPYNNFAQNLLDDTSAAFFQGWPMLDAAKAIEQFSGREAGTVGTSRNNAGTRYIETETKAAYFKVNFEALDGDLTGNIGLRLVNDETNANAYGGINYYRFPHVLDPYNLFIERGLGDIEGSEACPAAVMGINPETGQPDTRWAPQNEDQLQNCFAWALTHGYNFNDDNTTPYVDGEWVLPGGIDTNRLVYIDYTGDNPVVQAMNPLPNTVIDINGEEVSSPRSTHLQFGSAGEAWPFLDRSTSFVGPAGNVDKANVRTAPTSGKGSQTLLLPSVNVNYALNEEMIVRFAASKTMSRPTFDALAPRSTINENIWDPTASGDAGNTELKPLVSTNLDFSYEWYFNDSGVVSVALFHKDIKDLPERVVTQFHYLDVRDQYDLESANLLLPYDENRVPGDGDNCQQRRFVGGFSASEWYIGCHIANITMWRNSSDYKTGGVELGYTQNYDFLPGLLSGLGVSANYTYQQSKSESEEIGDTGLMTSELAMPLTPEHSANVTLFYEYEGLALRFAHRYTGEQRTDQAFSGGLTWLDETNRSDFSATYDVTDSISVSFHMTNVFEDTRREFYTADNARTTDNVVFLDEGNVLDNDDVTRERTAAIYDSGRQYRLSVRASF